MIFRQGDPCPGVFIVGSGLVRVFRMAPSGKEHTLHLCAPGGTFAEVAAIAGFDCPAFAEAIEESCGVLLPASAFRQALQEDHQLCLQLLTGMAGWVKHLVGMLEGIALRDAMGRLARYLLENTTNRSIRLQGLKKHLACHLNLTAETLSRTLRRMSEMQLVAAADDDSLLILNPEQLNALADGLSGEF